MKKSTGSSHGWMMTLGVVALLSGWACSPLPSKYIEQAERGVTLTHLTESPQIYKDKVVILGGVLVDEQQKGEHVWLRLKNRPLDQDYHPHRPVVNGGPEAGHFWVGAASKGDLPDHYRKWARMTVVGRVVGFTRGEPLLQLMYMRGWSYSGDDNDGWESRQDPAYRVTVPEGLHGEFQPQ